MGFGFVRGLLAVAAAANLNFGFSSFKFPLGAEAIRVVETINLSVNDLEGTVVDTGYAKYMGNRSYDNTVAYLGIPYAEPPLGDRRFRAPVSLNTTRIAQEANGSVIDATDYPDFCIQGSTGFGDAGGAGSEDCLKINIYAPYGATKDSNLPVIFYMHGGGYIYGNPACFPFDHWIHQSPNVIAVSVYYRLDSLGFLAVPEFSDSAIGDFNVGLQDQTEALKWVQKNIASFGGDPSRVTINGQSAGGGSVELHMVAKGNEGLFSGAIAQSVARTTTPTPEQMAPLFEFYAETAGCGTGSVTDKLACLRKADISALARAQDAAGTSFNGSYSSFHPMLDGKIITDYPTKLILTGQGAKVPLIVGSTSNETVLGGTNITAALKAVFPGLNSTDLQEFLEVYPASEFASAAQRFQVVTGESLLICAREILGQFYANYTKSWTYRYNQPNPTQNTSAVEHAAENWMMFKGINTGFNGTGTFTPMTPIEDAFAEELITYWLSFVRAQDPNTFKLDRSPEWAPYSTIQEEKQRMVLQQNPENITTETGSFMEQEPVSDDERCAFVASKYPQEQN